MAPARGGHGLQVAPLPRRAGPWDDGPTVPIEGGWPRPCRWPAFRFYRFYRLEKPPAAKPLPLRRRTCQAGIFCK